ncbi:MAG: ribosome-binding factor A [Holosporales bacterium]|nr:ribosome-binding factor A [Holosporales bacterium]
MRKNQLNLFLPEKPNSSRVEKVASGIKRVLSEIFQRQEIPSVFNAQNKQVILPNITVTHIKLSTDLRECTVWVTPLANKNAEDVELYFNLATPLIRKIFAKKSNMKFIPNFYFKLDSSILEVERIEKILQENKKKYKDPEA